MEILSISRRKFFQLTGFAAAGSVLAACAPKLFTPEATVQPGTSKEFKSVEDQTAAAKLWSDLLVEDPVVSDWPSVEVVGVTVQPVKSDNEVVMIKPAQPDNQKHAVILVEDGSKMTSDEISVSEFSYTNGSDAQPTFVDAAGQPIAGSQKMESFNRFTKVTQPTRGVTPEKFLTEVSAYLAGYDTQTVLQITRRVSDNKIVDIEFPRRTEVPEISVGLIKGSDGVYYTAQLEEFK